MGNYFKILIYYIIFLVMDLQIDELCKQPENNKHELKFIKFCGQCADASKSINEIMFCMKCYPKKRTHHLNHLKGYKLSDIRVNEWFKQFRDYVIAQRATICGKKIQHKNINLLFEEVDFEKLVHNNSFRKFILLACFWEQKKLIKQKVSQYIKKTPVDPEIISDPDDISIDWSQFDEVQQNSLENIESKLREQMGIIEEQQEIIDIIVQTYSSFSVQNCSLVMKRIDQCNSFQKYFMILSFLKLRIFNLLGETDKIKSLLKKIIDENPTFKNQSAYYYYRAQTFWRKVPQNQMSTDGKIYFQDPKSTYFYQLQSPQQYVNQLSSAIINCQNPIFYIGRAIGYICLGKYTEGIKDFERVKDSQNNGSILSNLNYSRIKNKTIHEEDFLDNIEDKQKGFILNAIKYFKTKKQYENVIKCCQVLLNFQQNNQFAKVQLIKAYLKLQKIKQAQQQMKRLNQKSKQLVTRKFLFANGRVQNSSTYYARAAEQYKLGLIQKQSAVGFFNLAVTLYHNKKWEQSMRQIQKAIKIKNCKKYRKLKLYLSICLRNFEIAKELITQFPESEYEQLANFLETKA